MRKLLLALLLLGSTALYAVDNIVTADPTQPGIKKVNGPAVTNAVIIFPNYVIPPAALSTNAATAGDLMVFTNGVAAFKTITGINPVPVKNQGVVVTTGVTSLDFTNAGVTASAVAGAVIVNIPKASVTNSFQTFTGPIVGAIDTNLFTYSTVLGAGTLVTVAFKVESYGVHNPETDFIMIKEQGLQRSSADISGVSGAAYGSHATVVYSGILVSNTVFTGRLQISNAGSKVFGITNINSIAVSNLVNFQVTEVRP